MEGIPVARTTQTYTADNDFASQHGTNTMLLSRCAMDGLMTWKVPQEIFLRNVGE